MGLDSFEKDGVTYFELYVPCPVCLDSGNITFQSYWVHGNNNCGGQLYIGNNAHILCRKCGEVKFESYWTVDCPDHNEKCKYATAFCTNHNFAFSPRGILCGVGQTTGITWTGIKWFNEYLENLVLGINKI